MTIRYEISAASSADFDELYALAKYLNSVNLPHDPEALKTILDVSEKSFSGTLRNLKHREYLFVLRDLKEKRVVGTSQILAQLGRRDAPYIYFDVRSEEKYSTTLDKHFNHQVLSIRYSYDGPTELGGLVLHPDYRGKPEKLGMLISYVRFLWIKMHRADFRDDLLAELLPPLEADGTSHLWEAVGRHFTDLSYQEADKLSKRNKEFIRTLFPSDNIYVPLLSKDAQGVIGKVGAQTQGVERMLARVGFEYVDRVDPFDGGPHYMCPTDKVSAVIDAENVRVASGFVGQTRQGFVAKELKNTPWFTAIPCTYSAGTHEILLDNEVKERLNVTETDHVWVLPTDNLIKKPA